ncbi:MULTISPECIES: hypothetical protein [Streptococcus]|uniref:Uncharacterized protein n=1 Tax=Streptococcus caledonicus TaxID=2614158 RepID=A0ABW0UFK3_9STRE|nr:hypothetical protein [Streptococcus sp. S784/96/1]
MVGGVIPFTVYSIWHDAYFEARKKPWEEVSYFLVILLIEFLSWKVILSEHFELKDSLSVIIQAIWIGVVGLTTLVKLIVRYF